MRSSLGAHALGSVGLSALSGIPHVAHFNATSVVCVLFAVVLGFILRFLGLALLSLLARGMLLFQGGEVLAPWRRDGDWSGHRLRLS